MIRKPVHMMFCILLLVAILGGCSKPTEIITMPPPTDTQVPLPPSETPIPPQPTAAPTDTQVPPPPSEMPIPQRPTKTVEVTIPVIPTPSPTPFLYIVKGDDTMLGIAFKFGTKLEDLMAANPKVDPHYMVEGMTLVIPAPIAQPEQPIVDWGELFGVWRGFWGNQNILMKFIYTMMGMQPIVGFEEAGVEYPSGDNWAEWWWFEGGILSLGDWVNGAWVKPFSASTDCINNPQATYEVFITTYRGFAPKTLRFVLVGKDHCIDRQTFLDGQTFTWVGKYQP